MVVNLIMNALDMIMVHKYLILEKDNGWHTPKAMKGGGMPFGRLLQIAETRKFVFPPNLGLPITKFVIRILTNRWP